MIVELTCPIVDTSATALGVSWNGPLPEILASRTVVGPTVVAGSLHLAVIGGSHVVTVDAPSGQFREEVSCTAHTAHRPLPTTCSRSNYELVTDTAFLSPSDFSTQAEQIAAGGQEWLTVSFPGTGPHHLTAVHGAWNKGRWEWSTHHLYPEECAIVSTRSAYQP